MDIARDIHGDKGTDMHPTIERHYRRLRAWHYSRDGLYPMPAARALDIAREGYVGMGVDLDGQWPNELGDGWTFTARIEWDDIAHLDECPWTFAEAFDMLRCAGQSKAVAADFARARLAVETERVNRTTYVGVVVEVTAPDGRSEPDALWGIDYDDADPLSDAYCGTIALEVAQEARAALEDRADERARELVAALAL